MRLHGRRILITAATGATGEAIALLCAQEGARLALTSRRGAEALHDLVMRCDAAGGGGEAIALAGDPSTEEGAKRLADLAAQALGGGLDGAVYNVGGFVSSDARAADTATEDWEQMLQQHLSGAFNLLRAALPYLAQSGSGSAVVISASESTRQRGNVAYAVAKGAQGPLVRKVAREYRPESVRVNLVQPRVIEERPIEGQVTATPRALSESPQPEDIAFACAYLLSNESRLVTGQVITVDGGREL
jgi:NAD(P)-dependent dehydrogenase (short-subunit alcohol dehydrogenase family)